MLFPDRENANIAIINQLDKNFTSGHI